MKLWHFACALPVLTGAILGCSRESGCAAISSVADLEGRRCGIVTGSALQDAVDAEDKSNPLTDDQLVDYMASKGYRLARRTVAKYRDQLNIPKARLRKELV